MFNIITWKLKVNRRETRRKQSLQIHVECELSFDNWVTLYGPRNVSISDCKRLDFMEVATEFPHFAGFLPLILGTKDLVEIL